MESTIRLDLELTGYPFIRITHKAGTDDVRDKLLKRFIEEAKNGLLFVDDKVYDKVGPESDPKVSEYHIFTKEDPKIILGD